MNQVPPLKMLIKKIKKHLFPRQAKQDLAGTWQGILTPHSAEWERIKRSCRNGPRVLFATGASGHGTVAHVESALAVALTLRGANVQFLICDQFFPACSQALSTQFSNLQEFVDFGPSRSKCIKCFSKGKKIRDALGLSIHLYSELVSRDEQKQADELSKSVEMNSIPGYRLDGLAIGEHALAGALRFFARGTLDGEPYAEEVLRRYFKAALLAAFGVRRLFKNSPFDCAVSFHGIYIPDGVLGEMARKERVRVVNWVRGYRKRCFIFSHNETYHHTMISEPVEKWETMDWNPRVESQLVDYLKSRWQGTQDWITFVKNNPQFDLETIHREIGIDFSKCCIGMLTNVMWDAQLHYPANAFPNMLEWIVRTIDYFARRSDLQLLIRVHPAEITGIIPSRQPIMTEIQRAFPTLPDNVFAIGPESRLSTYAAMSQCDSVIIYGTKTGVELTSMGIPVIVAGEAWIRNKGITLDASTIEEYFSILDRLPLGVMLDEATTRRARMYAYHFFFRRMIPLDFMEPTNSWPPLRMVLKELQDLEPGKYSGLDVICNGILKGTDFIYPAERV